MPQTLSPLTPTMGRKGMNSGESSPVSLSGSGRSETEHSNTSRGNTPSPIFFHRGAVSVDTACGKVIIILHASVGLHLHSKVHNMEAACLRLHIHI